jgi:oxalate decarboxylase/phosphoglucose isomerase-like protein (cupin superfamily)
MKIQIAELQNRGDARGVSFSPPAEALAFLGRLADLYVASTLQGEVRGNHFHLHKRQVIVVLPGTAWSLHFDQGEGTPVEHRRFDGGMAVLVLVAPGASQAVRNDGEQTLWMVVGSSEAYDPATVVARRVI